MRAKPFRIRRSVALGAATLLAIGGVGLLSVGTASVASDGVSSLSAIALNSPAVAPSVFTGGTNQAASGYTFTMPNSFASGDVITFAVETSAAVANCTSSATDWVGFTGTPAAVAVRNNGMDDTDVTPTFTATLSATPGDPVACGTALVKDTLTLAITNTSAGTAADTYGVTLSGVEYNLGAAADTGPVDVLMSSTTSTATTTDYTAPSNATVALEGRRFGDR